MGFFKRLFTGDICPIDNIVRKTPEYQDTMHQVTVASLDLEKTLTPERHGNETGNTNRRESR